MEIAGKVVLLTGASAGIGLATARSFAREQAKLALVARSASKLGALAHELRAAGCEAVAISADLRDPVQIQRAVAETVAHFGHVDILINNAGQAAAGTIADVNPDDFRAIFELNVVGPLLMMQAVIPLLRALGGGLIINVSSMVSKMRLPGLAAYAATKSALNMLSDTARVELAQEHIRVISIFPRMTATDFSRNSLGNQVLRQQQRAHTDAVPVDSAEYVAEKIVAATVEEAEEQYMV
jgi:short-subunit dehydrogenase